MGFIPLCIHRGQRLGRKEASTASSNILGIKRQHHLKLHLDPHARELHHSSLDDSWHMSEVFARHLQENDLAEIGEHPKANEVWLPVSEATAQVALELDLGDQLVELNRQQVGEFDDVARVQLKGTEHDGPLAVLGTVDTER